MLFYILKGIIWILGLLPLKLLYLFSDAVFPVLYYVLRYRRKVVITNLRNSFPEKAEKDLKKISKKFYHHMTNLMVEIIKYFHMSEGEIKRRCYFRNPELLDKYYNNGQSVACLLGHYGNWEWMSSYSLCLKETEFYPLYRPLYNAHYDKMMYNLRSRLGAKPIPSNDVLRVIYKGIKEAKVFNVGFIADQAPYPVNAHWMEFLNQDTPVFTGAERIALKYNMPIVTVRVEQVRRGRYELEFMLITENPQDYKYGEITEIYMKFLEEEIKRQPELWLWSHKRWKHKR